MRKIQIIITVVSCITLASCFRRPRKPAETPKPKLYFPKDLREPGQNLRSDWQVPNEKFCSEMMLQPAQHYMVLPWWYNYCANVYERTEKKNQHSLYNLALYRNVLDKLQAYKKMQMRRGN